jgi:cell wall-associated NlpC family hydrolase
MRKAVLALWFFAFILLFLSAPSHSATTHKVKSGETLKKIARKHHTTVDKLKAANNLSSSALKRGQVLVISDDDVTTVQPRSKSRRHATKEAHKKSVQVIEEVASEETNDEYIEYRVRRGDTLDKLARKFNINKQEIAELNNITARKRRLSPGTTVFIPKANEEGEEAPVVLNDRPLKPWKNEEERGILVKVAKSFAGAPYRYGGDSIRGLDCSAFVKKMYEIFEVQLPRSAREQFCYGPRVEKENLLTGDLVFFKTKRHAKYPTHVGIYIGDDKFIHASSVLRRGVKVDHLTDSYFKRTYIGAVRVKAPPAAEQSETDLGHQKTAGNT